jgi:hypothetical protein
MTELRVGKPVSPNVLAFQIKLARSLNRETMTPVGLSAFGPDAGAVPLSLRDRAGWHPFPQTHSGRAVWRAEN